LNISSGSKEVSMDEVSIITDYIQQEAGLAADLIWGNCIDEALGEKISVTIIATGFQTQEERAVEKSQVRKVSLLTPENAPMVTPVNTVNAFMAAEPEVPQEQEMALKTEVQPDLFAGFFNQNDKPSEESTLTDTQYVRHSLQPEEPAQAEEPVFEFGLKSDEPEYQFNEPVAEAQPVEQIMLPEPEPEAFNPDENKTDESIEEQLRKSRERILRLKDLSMKLRTANGLQELENEPAYKRKQMALQQVPHSSESQVSRFTLSNDEGVTEIRPNNSFLHDNVD
jgi:cell division protein FtsZ